MKNMESSLGAHLRALRKVQHKTQEQIADMVGVERSYIAQLELGYRYIPSRDILVRLADALRTNVLDLLVVAGYLPEPPDDLPEYYTYISRKFADQPKLQRALLATYEALTA